MAFNTAYDLESLVVNTKAATVYTAFESSLFLGGNLIPQVQIPAGSTTAQIPLMGSVTATKLTSADPDNPSGDFTDLTITDTKKTVEADIYAARHVLRDMGGIDPQETGRVLGHAIQTAFDKDVMAVLGNLTGQEIAGSAGTNDLTVAEIQSAVGTIRGNGETGPLVGVVGAGAYAALMSNIGSQAFAGGEFQNSAMRNGFFGKIAGVDMYVSSYLDATNTGQTNAKAAVFGADAMRIAMFKNVDIEIARRPAAVGFDVVASLHAGVGLVDANRGVIIKDAS
tara:strand:+ start:647 stop:1492 length:846 start_codon:yes stop_codon:yes gene_type:complete